MSMDLWAIWDDGEESWYPRLPDSVGMSSGRAFKALNARIVILVNDLKEEFIVTDDLKIVPRIF